MDNPTPINYGALLLTAANIFNNSFKDKDNQPIDFVNQGLTDNSMNTSYSDYRGYNDPNTGMVYAEFGIEMPDLIPSTFNQPKRTSNAWDTMPKEVEKNMESPSIDKQTALYLTHQQGVGGYKAIAKAAATGRPISDFYKGKEDIESNMKGNVGSDYWKKYGSITAANFIDYWKGKMSRAYKKAETKSTPYDSAFKSAASQTGLDPTFLKAVSFIESGGNADSNRGKATQYKGLFQINQSELGQYGTDIYNPYQNTMAAASILAKNKSALKLEEGGEYDLDPDEVEYYKSQGYEFDEI